MSTEELPFLVTSILGNDSRPTKHSTVKSYPRHFSASSRDLIEEGPTLGQNPCFQSGIILRETGCGLSY